MNRTFIALFAWAYWAALGCSPDRLRIGQNIVGVDAGGTVGTSLDSSRPVAKIVTPIMTGPNTPAPFEATGATFADMAVYAAWHLFDGELGDDSDHWISPGLPAEVGITLDSAKTVVSYTLHARFDTLTNRLPMNWQLFGHNPPTGYVPVDTRADILVGPDGWIQAAIPSNTTSLTFNVANPGQYAAYYLNITEVNGSTVADLIELQLLGY